MPLVQSQFLHIFSLLSGLTCGAVANPKCHTNRGYGSNCLGPRRPLGPIWHCHAGVKRNLLDAPVENEQRTDAKKYAAKRFNEFHQSLQSLHQGIDNVPAPNNCRIEWTGVREAIRLPRPIARCTTRQSPKSCPAVSRRSARCAKLAHSDCPSNRLRSRQ